MKDGENSVCWMKSVSLSVWLRAAIGKPRSPRQTEWIKACEDKKFLKLWHTVCQCAVNFLFFFSMNYRKSFWEKVKDRMWQETVKRDQPLSFILMMQLHCRWGISIFIWAISEGFNARSNNADAKTMNISCDPFWSLECSQPQYINGHIQSRCVLLASQL